MVIIVNVKPFKTKKDKLKYLKSKLKGFTNEQKRNSDMINLASKSSGELDYKIQQIYRQHLTAVTYKGKEIIVTTKEKDSLYKESEQYQNKIKRSAKNYGKRKINKNNKGVLGTTNAIIIALVDHGFNIPEARWLVAKFGLKMARWHSQIASNEKEEFFDEVDKNPYSIERYLE